MAKVINTIEKVWARLGKDIGNAETMFINGDILDMNDVLREITFDPNEKMINMSVRYDGEIIALARLTVRENRINCYYVPETGIPTATDGKYYGNVMTTLNQIINEQLQEKL